LYSFNSTPFLVSELYHCICYVEKPNFWSNLQVRGQYLFDCAHKHCEIVPKVWPYYGREKVYITYQTWKLVRKLCLETAIFSQKMWWGGDISRTVHFQNLKLWWNSHCSVGVKSWCSNVAHMPNSQTWHWIMCYKSKIFNPKSTQDLGGTAPTPPNPSCWN